MKTKFGDVIVVVITDSSSFVVVGGKKFARKNCYLIVVRVNAHFSQIRPITWQEIALNDLMTFVI